MSEPASRLAHLAEGVERWLRDDPALPVGLDPATRQWCLARLRPLASAAVLNAKLRSELGERPWRPVGRLLMVIAEGDVLGTACGLLAAHATGNRMRIKARATRPMLMALKAAIGLDDEVCEVLDWSSETQADAQILAGVDAVLLAGGANLIAHYRRVTPVGVRLIEYGPRLSAAVLWPDAAQAPTLASSVLETVGLFSQGVCSSPQWILVPDADMARALFARLGARLGELPPLPEPVALAQMTKARAMGLSGRLGEDVQVHFAPGTGWGVTLGATLAETRFLAHGINLVSGDAAAHLARLHALYPHQLQTLGEMGTAPPDVGLPDGFLRRSPLNRMHERDLLAPHDGGLELPALVNFVDLA